MDAEDAEALRWVEGVEVRGGAVYVKFPLWDRWKRLDKYLTGTLTVPRNGNTSDFRRENLIPSVSAWRENK